MSTPSPFRRCVQALVTLTGAWLVAGTTALGTIDFAPRVNVPTTGETYWMAAGNLDGDGVLDLVVVNSLNTVAIHKGLGGGNYSAPQNVPVGIDPFGVTLGDYNADAKLDIATANSGSNNVTLLLGDGLGGVASTATIPVGKFPGTITAGLVNADDRLDLVVMNFQDSNATLLLGNGDGTFAGSTLNLGQFGGFDSAVGDVTGDGIADLVTTGAELRVFPGPNGPTLPPPTSIAGRFFPFRVIATDLNADGRPDIATANLVGNSMSVTLSLGGTAFATPVTRPASAGPSGVAPGDVNGDGIVDLAVTNLFSKDVSVFEGTGGGGFRPAKQFRAGDGPQGIAISDVTGDGKGDLLVASGGNSVAVLVARPLAPGTTGSAKVRVPCTAPRKVELHFAISCIGVGMSPAMVREFNGPPNAVSRVAGSIDYVYRYPGMRVRFSGFSNDVMLVTTTRPRVGLANGVRVGASGTLVKKRFPRAVCRTAGGAQTCTVTRRAGQAALFTRFTITRQVITSIEVGLRLP